MKKVFLMLFAFLFLLVSCAQEKEKDISESPSLRKGVTEESAEKTQPNKRKSVSADVKTALKEGGNVLLASDEMDFEAVGSWSAEDSRAFYKNCNEIALGKTANPNLNLEKYCSCLKVIMLDNKYGPRELTRAVKKEQVQVLECLKGSITVEE